MCIDGTQLHLQQHLWGKIGFHGSYKLQSPLATSDTVSAAAVAAAANCIYNCYMMAMAFSLLHAALSAPSPRNWSGPITSPAWTVFFSLEMLGAEMWKEMPSKYWRKPREIQVIAAVKWSCKWEVTQVANGRWPKTASCRATDEDEWVTPTSVASPRTQFSNKHQLLMITIEIFWVLWLQSFFPGSWGVRSPDPHRRLGRGTWLRTCLEHVFVKRGNLIQTGRKSQKSLNQWFQVEQLPVWPTQLRNLKYSLWCSYFIRMERTL